MRGGFYRITRDLHLYAGLFISPFVLVFSVTVFFLVHTWLPRIIPETSTTRLVSSLPLPAEVEALSGRALIDALKPALERAGLRGEIGFVRHLVPEGKLIVPVTVPGRETTVTIDIARHEGSVVIRQAGLAQALVMLHKFPGPHLPNTRLNWFYLRAWSWAADATVYLILLISVTGIYLWYVLRAERRLGFILLGAGALAFFGLAYALSH